MVRRVAMVIGAQMDLIEAKNVRPLPEVMARGRGAPLSGGMSILVGTPIYSWVSQSQPENTNALTEIPP